MPYPKKVDFGTGKFRITSQSGINLLGVSGDTILEEAANNLLRKLNFTTLSYFMQEKVKLNDQFSDASIFIQVNEKEENPVNVDESYKLSVNQEKVQLIARTTIGALRGMETLLQLVMADSAGYYFPAVEIDDEPRFKWRGMMVDVARHFIPPDILKRNIDAMSKVKMNVLHLHLSDDEGFRVESKVFPRLHQSGSNNQYYTQSELREIIDYAAAKGIMVYPEFDLPGHCTSWLAGYPELASGPGPYEPGPRYKLSQDISPVAMLALLMNYPTPAINPAKEEVYQFLDEFIAEMATIFTAPYYHTGADENNGKVWENNPQIIQFMKDNKINNTDELQRYFVNRLRDILRKHNKQMIGWEEVFNTDLPEDVVVQVWGAMGAKSANPVEIAEKGNPVLISKGFYLDYFYPASFHYLNPEIPDATNRNLLGGEAALWAELVDENTFEGRAWPRAAAVAERLWSPADIIDVDDMYRRLFIISDRLEIDGLDHNFNRERMLASLCNLQETESAQKLIDILTPVSGYVRLMAQMRSPDNIKSQSVPLVSLVDLVACDSRNAWNFGKLVENYLHSEDLNQKEIIKQQLNDWQEAANQIAILAKNAPNLGSLEDYAGRIALVTDIGLQAVEGSLNGSRKSLMLGQLDSLKQPGDLLEIAILNEIRALVTGEPIVNESL